MRDTIASSRTGRARADFVRFVFVDKSKNAKHPAHRQTNKSCPSKHQSSGATPRKGSFNVFDLLFLIVVSSTQDLRGNFVVFALRQWRQGGDEKLLFAGASCHFNRQLKTFVARRACLDAQCTRIEGHRATPK